MYPPARKMRGQFVRQHNFPLLRYAQIPGIATSLQLPRNGQPSSVSLWMSEIPVNTARLPHNASLIALDPIYGPIWRLVGELILGENVLAQSDGVLCFRPVQKLSETSAPEAVSLVMLDNSDIAALPANLILDARQKCGLPQADSVLAVPLHCTPDPLELADIAWKLVTVELAERLIVNQMAIATGPIASRPCRTMSESIRAFAGDLHLEPSRIEPYNAGAVLYFQLPTATRTLRLVTPSSSTISDARRLGVAVIGIVLGGDPIDLNSPILVRGFYPLESSDPISWRWTDGEALLLLPTKQAPTELGIAITNWHLDTTA
jgi:hypothetical protein